MIGRRNFNQSRGQFWNFKVFLRFQINHYSFSNEINLLRYYLFDYFFPRPKTQKESKSFPIETKPKPHFFLSSDLTTVINDQFKTD